MLFLLGLEPQDKVQFATPKLSKHPASKAMPCYFLTFRPRFLLGNLPSQRVHEKELWMTYVPMVGSPATWQSLGARSGDLFSYKMGRLTGCRRGLVSMTKRGGERHCWSVSVTASLHNLLYTALERDVIQPDAVCFTLAPH